MTYLSGGSWKKAKIWSSVARRVVRREVEAVAIASTEEFSQQELEGSSQGGFKLRPLLRTLRRYSLFIAGCTVLGTSLGYLKVATEPTHYSGKFDILVEPVTTEARIAEPTAVTRTGGVPSERTFTLDYPTQIAILRSPGMLGRVVETIRATYPGYSLQQLREGLSIQRPGRRREELRILNVAYIDENPERTQAVLDELARVFLNYSLEERKSRIGEGIRFIEERLPALQNRARGIEREIQMLQQEYSFFSPQSEAGFISEQFQTVRQERTEAQLQLQEQRRAFERLQSQVTLAPEEALAASVLSEDPIYQQLTQRIQELENQIAEESARFTPNSPSIQALEARRDNLLPQLQQRAEQLLNRNDLPAVRESPIGTFQTPTRRNLIGQMIETDNAIARLELRERQLSERQAELEASVQAFPEVIREYNELTRELEAVNATRNRLLTEREKLLVEAAQTQVPWELLYEPSVSSTPIPNENASKFLILGAFGGLAIGAATAILIEKRRDIFQTSEEMQDDLVPALFESIPQYQQPQMGASQTQSDFQEAFNSLYAKLLFFYPDPPIRSLAIASPTAGDGKTTVAFNLARAAAATGQRVLLVEANLRSPQLHEDLGLEARGLAELLDGQEELSWQKLVQHSNLSEKLSILTAGRASADAAQLLASERMQQLAAAFQDNYDLIVYDTPQLCGFTDPKFVTTHTDGTLVVVRVSGTSREATQQMLEELEAFNLPILGIIANEGKKPKGKSRQLVGIRSEEASDVHQLELQQPMTAKSK